MWSCDTILFLLLCVVMKSFCCCGLLGVDEGGESVEGVFYFSFDLEHF